MIWDTESFVFCTFSAAVPVADIDGKVICGMIRLMSTNSKCLPDAGLMVCSGIEC